MKVNFINHWRWSSDWKGFILFNVWKTKDSFGIQVANIGIEFISDWKSLPRELKTASVASIMSQSGKRIGHGERNARD